MRFTTERAAFLSAVQNLSRIVTKTSLPVLEGILISAEKGKLTLVSYNLEMSMKKEIYANCDVEGDIVISAKLLTEILRKSDGIQIEIESDDRLMCHIKSGNAVFDIMGMSAEDFPEIPSVPETDKISVPAGLLKDMVRGTLFAVASEESSRPILTGINVTVGGGLVQFTGIDGRRIAIRREQINCSGDYNFVITGKAIGEAVKIISDEDEIINIYVTKKLISFCIDDYLLVSRLLEGEFVNYEKLLAKSYTQEIRVNVKNIIDIFDRISLVVSDRFTTPIKWRLEENLSTFTCSSPLGKATDTYGIELKGEEFEIGVNSQLITEALRATETDEVFIRFNGNTNGIVIEPTEGDSFIYMVMPVRLK